MKEDTTLIESLRALIKDHDDRADAERVADIQKRITDVAGELKDGLGYSASYEYPGYISICNLAFGIEGDSWTGNTEQGEALETNETLPGREAPPLAVAASILRILADQSRAIAGRIYKSAGE